MMNDDIKKFIEEKGLTTQDVLKYIVDDSIDRFKELHSWKEKDYAEFEILLNHLKDVNGKKDVKTGEKGKALEKIVNFIIRKTYFFEVYENITTGTNEIDQIIRLSDKGLQALGSLQISRELLQIEEDIFLGECKNYAQNLSVTYVGKFYGLLKSTDCSFGIIFSYKGLTGNEESWTDSHGLLKIFRLIEKYESQNPNFYILEFNIDDYEKIKDGVSFFDLVKEKKTAIQIGTNHNQFLDQSLEDTKMEVIEKVNKLKKAD